MPAEEQVAAATAGADELKQAAKRVRDAKKKAPAASTHVATEMPIAAHAAVTVPTSPAQAGTAPWDAGSPEDSVESLRQRVAALTAENAALREQVASLQAQLRRQADTSEPAAELPSPF